MATRTFLRTLLLVTAGFLAGGVIDWLVTPASLALAMKLVVAGICVFILVARWAVRRKEGWYRKF